MTPAVTTGSRAAPWIFVGPMLAGLLIFRIGPSIVAVFASFTEWNIRTTPTWIGLDNYREMIASDLF
ncbi:MAG: hypothetical protein AAGD35_07645 [Actinomycetota bacterium]